MLDSPESQFVNANDFPYLLMEGNRSTFPSAKSILGRSGGHHRMSPPSYRAHHSASSAFYQPLSQHCLLNPYTYGMMHHYRQKQSGPIPFGPTSSPNSCEEKASVQNYISQPSASQYDDQSVIQKQIFAPPKFHSRLPVERKVTRAAAQVSAKTLSHSPSGAKSKSSKSWTRRDIERKRDMANIQERRRMHKLNDALNRLREASDKKL